MKFFSSLLFLLLWTGIALGQTVTIDEDFGDGDYTTNPSWTDSESKHIVNGSNLLQLDAPEVTEKAVISTASSAAYGEWETLINLRFNPSGSNLAKFYILSDTQNMKGDVNGYFIMIGDTEEEISLYRQDGATTTKIIDGADGLIDANPVNVRIKATRDLDGNWELLADASGGTSYTSQGTTTDGTYATSNYIGLFSDYTSTRHDLFEYDDIKVTKIVPPLAVQSATIIDNQTIDVTFNLDLDPASVDETDFNLNQSGDEPDNASLQTSNIVKLTYNSSLQSNRYTLTISDINDTDGNTLDPNPQTSTFTLFGAFSQGDIIINEFVYDYPSTINEEYIEIKNTSNKYLNLTNWEIADNSNSTVLGASSIPIEPDSFLVISADTTDLSTVFGNRSYYEAEFPALNNNSPDAIQIITNNDITADSLEYTSDWGGTDVSLERRSVSTSSIYQENWGDSPNPDGGTPGAANEISADTSLPELVNLIIVDNQTLKIAFTERLANSPATNSTNFNLHNGNSITNSQQIAADSVELSLDSALQNATNYQLTIDNQQDIFGNTATSLDTSFTYYNPSPVDSGDVAINEFLAAPPSNISEYVELYNHSSKSLDLQGWTLSDAGQDRSTITSSSFIVPPDSFIVIAKDNSLTADYPNISMIVMSSLPALNNGGDAITIRNSNGVLLDSLTYDSDWGEDEIALERRSIDVPATYKANWGDSPNPNGGTPGFANEVETDQTPPAFEELYAINANNLQLTFSESITPSSATDKQNYQISADLNIQMILAKEDSVQLLLSEDLVSEQTYEVSVSNLSDIFGNTISETTKKTTYLRIEEAQSRDIVINEIMYNPGSNEADFVELYNISDKNFDLSNWQIGDASSDATIPENTQLLAGEYLLLTGGEIFAGSISNAIDVSSFPALNSNTPDVVFLKNDGGQTIDSLRYAQTWGGSEDGTSIERKDPEAASNDASNWQTSSANSGYSAGTQNTVYQQDTTPPEVIFSKTLINGDIEVRFNEFIRLTDELTFLQDEQELTFKEFDPMNGNRIILTKPTAKEFAANGTTITVQNLSDVKGNTTPSSEVPIAQPMESTEVVINEIMFNPLDDPDDNQADQGEYIELRNTQDYAVSLEGLYLHDAPDEDGEVRALKPVTSTAKWVPAQGKVLVHADPAPTFSESKVANFFELESPDLESVMRVDRSSLSLSSSDDAIFISDSTGTTIDSVFYDNSWHNPNIIDTRGVALERVSPGGPSDDDSNWGSSVNTKGGTPNKENSLYQENAQQQQETGISFTPNPFSPDNDGSEDNLFINYKLDQQDYLMKVRIYDRYGRLVRELADGDQAGLEGQLIWDGRKDDGSRNRIGIYIVVFEAYDSTSGADKAFKETVVLARKLN